MEPLLSSTGKEEIQRTSFTPDDIPSELKELKLWIVWEIPPWYKGEEKPKKIPRTPDGKGYPTKGFAERKEFGTFAEVNEACKANPNFYPGIWLTDVPNLICMDYDSLDGINLPAQPEWNSYSEYSVYLGYHVFCYYTGKDLPTIKGIDIRSNSWIVMTGNMIRGRDKINDLTKDLVPGGSIASSNGDITIIEEKLPLVITDHMHHQDIRRYVGNQVRLNVPLAAIQAAVAVMNGQGVFERVRGATELINEVDSAWDWHTRKKAKDTEQKEKKNADNTPAKQSEKATEVLENGIAGTNYWLCKKFCDEYPTVRFNTNSGKWYFFGGKLWQEDEIFFVHKAFVEWSHKQYNLAAPLNDNDAKDTVKLLRVINNHPAYIDNALQIQVPILNSQFDPDGDTLNTQNCAINLKTWECVEHSQDLMCRSITNAKFDPDATCPKWESHVKTCFNNDESLIKWFQVFCGYILRQGNPEQIFTIWHGDGLNGKSVCINTLNYVLGNYSHTTSPSTFESKRMDDAGAANPGLCDCAGKRLISCSENKDGSVLDSSVVKISTGGDEIEARYLHQNPFRFRISGAIVYLGNHRPVIKDMSVGMWRRLKLVPFLNKIPEDKIIREYEKQLYPEADGILQWMIKGLKMYDELNGFPKCESIEKATSGYKMDNDVVSQYIDQCCFSSPSASALMEDVVRDCLAFAESMGTRVSKKTIRQRLQDLGYKKGAREKSGYTITGISISNPFVKKVNTQALIEGSAPS